MFQSVADSMFEKAAFAKTVHGAFASRKADFNNDFRLMWIAKCRVKMLAVIRRTAMGSLRERDEMIKFPREGPDESLTPN